MRIIFFLLLAVSAQAQTQLYGTTIINATSGLRLPVGNDSQRPAAQFGMIRANTESGGVEIYDGSWQRATYFTGGVDKNSRLLYDGSGWVAELPVHGELFTHTPATVSLSSTYSVIAMTDEGLVTNFEQAGNGLRYTGTYPIAVKVTYTVSIETSTADEPYYLRLRVNSVGQPSTKVESRAPAPDDTRVISNSCLLYLNTNDIVYLEHSCSTAATNFTVKNANLVIIKL